MLPFRGVLPILVASLLGGCESYNAMPLGTGAAGSPALAAAASGLKRRAIEMRNPLLRPVEVDPASGYSAEELAVAAVVLNPTLRGIRDQTVVANAQANNAALLPNPTLSFSVDIPVGANTTGEVAGYGVGLDWEITSLITHGAKLDAAKKTAERGRLDTAWQEWQIAQAARQATYDVLLLRRQLATSRSLESKLDGIVDASRRALVRHDVTATDASAAEAAVGELRIAVATTERDLADAELALHRAVGIAPDEPLPLDDRLILPSLANLPAAAVLSERIEEHRIDLAALRRGYESQEAAVRGAILGQFPKIALGISHTRDTGDFLTLGPALTVDLPVFDRNQGAIAVEKATRQQLFDEYHSRLFEARSDIARAAAALHAIGNQMHVVSEQVTTLERLLAVDEKALSQGDVDMTTFYTAAVSLAQRQTDLFKFRQEFMRGWITLEMAAGVYLPVESNHHAE